MPGDESSNASLGGNAVHLETTSVHRPVPNALPGVEKRGHEPAPDEQPPGAKRYRLTKKTAEHRSTECLCEPPESTSGTAFALGAAAATALAVSLASSKSVSDSSKNTSGKRAADAAEVRANASAKRQHEGISDATATEPLIAAADNLETIQCDPSTTAATLTATTAAGASVA